MAGNAIIGALRVVLGADTAALEKGLKDAQSGLAKFAKDASAIAAGIGLEKIAEKLAAALTGALKQGLVEADKLFKMSQSFGVPIDQLSALKHAADLSGVSLESLGKSLGKLSRTMMEAGANPTGEAAKSFQALGISVKNADGSLKSSSQMMTEIAGKFANMKDGAGKTALAIQLFGRAGADLIPLLNLGKTGLQEMITEAQELGIVFDQRTGAAAEAFNDNLTRLKKVFDGIIIKVTAEMLPALLRFSQVVLDAAKNQSLMKSIAEGLISVFQYGVSAVLTITFAFRRFSEEVVAWGNLVAQVAPAAANFFAGLMTMQAAPLIKAAQALQGISGAWEKVKLEAGTTEQQFAKLNEYIQKFKNGAVEAANALVKAPTAKNDAPIIQGNKDALDKYLGSLSKKNASMQADLETIGLSEGAHQRLKVILEAEAIAKDNNLKITDKIREKLLQAANETGNLAARLEETKDRWNEFRGAVLQVRSSLENAFVDAITQAKSFKDVIKSLISDMARLAAQSAFRSLFGGASSWTDWAGALFRGSSGAASSLGGAAGGLANFASGGSFKVGGSGGIDSQLVAFKASPNERVSITRPDQDIGGGISVSMPINISADGADASQLSRLVAAVNQLRNEIPSRAIEAIRMANKSNMKLA